RVTLRHAAHRRDEAIAVLGNGFDQMRLRGTVAELPAQGLDALRQDFVGDRDALPDFSQEALLADQRARVLQQQQQRVEVTAVELHERLSGKQASLERVEAETVKFVAANGHSALPQGLLMSFSASGASVRAQLSLEDNA